MRIASVLLSTALLCQPIAAFAATTVTTSAYGVFSNVKVLNTVGVTVGPVAQVTATGTPAQNLNNGVASLDTTVGLGTSGSGFGLVSTGLDLGTGVIAANARADNLLIADPTRNVGSVVVNGLGLDLFLQALVVRTPILGIDSTAITSITSVKLIDKYPLFEGRSILSNLTVSLLGAVPLLTLGAGAEVTPNFTVLGLPGLLSITLNEQYATRSGNTFGYVTNALHINFNNYVLNGKALTGSLIVGHSRAEVFVDALGPLPEPGVWLQMIVGFGLTGLVVRRRRTAMLLASHG